MRICVFLSAADLDDRYTRPAREFAKLLGKGGHTLVWGGSDVGPWSSWPRRSARASTRW
jgi:predicted Rossmann-fold nucleotide-binding protein